MPFTQNVGPYVGGNFMFQGLSNLGSGIAEGMQALQKAKQDAAGGDVILNIARQQGILDPATEAEYHNGNLATKNGIIANLAKGFAFSQQQQKQLQDERELALRYRAYNRQLADSNFTPSSEAIPVHDPSGNVIGHHIQTSKNSYQFRPIGSAGTDTWEDLNKDVRAATGADLGDWQNAGNKRQEGGSIVADITKPDVFGQQVQKTIRVPATSYNQFMQRFNALQGGPPMDMVPKSTPAPAPSATPVQQSGLDKILGMIRGTRPVATPAPSVTPAPATAGGPSVAAAVTAAPSASVRIIEKNGHHYEVDDANKKVVRQID